MQNDTTITQESILVNHMLNSALHKLSLRKSKTHEEVLKDLQKATLTELLSKDSEFKNMVLGYALDKIVKEANKVKELYEELER